MIVGGKELECVTLQTFFTFHSALLPFLSTVTCLVSFWRVRKAGGYFISFGWGKTENVAGDAELCSGNWLQGWY